MAKCYCYVAAPDDPCHQHARVSLDSFASRWGDKSSPSCSPFATVCHAFTGFLLPPVVVIPEKTGRTQTS